MSRIHKLENIYKEQLIKHQVDNVSDFIQSILNADITKGKYARFLLECFLNDKLLEEDLMGGLESTLGQAISLFDNHKNKLPVHERSIYALNSETKLPLYQSPGDLWNSVKQFQGELSGKELKKEEQEKIYRETEFVYKDEETGFQIVSPLTEKSAKWWGKGTRWCTSAEKNNMFWSYAKNAPLLILLMPNGDKLQLWNNNIQFMDEADNEVTLEYIEQNWKLLEPICKWLNDLRYIPNKYKTKELCEISVKKNGLTLSLVPDKYKTEELCLEAIKQNGRTLYHIPKHLRTKELCELAVKQNGYVLPYVPLEYETLELCKLAIQNNGDSLRYVPKYLITKELCELAVRNDGYSLQYVPDKYIDYNLCLEAVKQNGLALQDVPIKLKTQELCELAVRQNEWTLDSVPDKLKHYAKDEIFELPIEKYQEIFQEIKTFFSIKNISLEYHNA
jgi:hypothetical protein